ncbi:Na+/H+ ion antiporter subunit [Halopolyspora algeriensis]|uniref:Na+/H+ ion antiporter subunit n=1 Tax=Halopolyspora algeriensis TaxID=1500506 RepID=A0A368VD63_9ACTN|nr:Na+/H+ antiporter subunit E [Halopolyspora algeriensis]RCW39129.1 Na+/H+ ion antiporter subunit [Halopolyspora algeriensis]
MSVLRRIANIAMLVLFYFGDLVQANLELTWVLITPGTVEPAVIAVEVHTDSPWLITAFANLITLSPGTTTLEVADDGSEIYVHLLTTRPLGTMRADLMALQHRLLKAAT